MRALVIVLSIVGAVGAVLGGLFWWSRKPKVDILKVDTANKSVEYKMTAGGEESTGTKLFSDKATTQKVVGKWKFVASAEGKMVVLCIMENDRIVSGKLIDFVDKPGTVTDLDPAWSGSGNAAGRYTNSGCPPGYTQNYFGHCIKNKSSGNA